MYCMNNYVNIVADELTNFLIDEAYFKQSQSQMSIYYKYATGGSNFVLLSYVDECAYFYTPE